MKQITENQIIVAFEIYYHVQQVIFRYPTVKICEFFGDKERKYRDDDNYYHCKCIKQSDIDIMLCFFSKGEEFSCSDELLFICCNKNQLDLPYTSVDNDDRIEDIKNKRNNNSYRSTTTKFDELVSKSEPYDNKELAYNIMWLKVLCILLQKQNNKEIFDIFFDLLKGNDINFLDENKLINTFSKALFIYANAEMTPKIMSSINIKLMVVQYINNIKQDVYDEGNLEKYNVDGFCEKI